MIWKSKQISDKPRALQLTWKKYSHGISTKFLIWNSKQISESLRKSPTKMAFNLFRRKSSGRRTSSRLSRHEPVSDKADTNKVRGHALFVRFMERRGLSDCITYFPEDMTLGLYISAFFKHF